MTPHDAKECELAASHEVIYNTLPLPPPTHHEGVVGYITKQLIRAQLLVLDQEGSIKLLNDQKDLVLVRREVDWLFSIHRKHVTH